MEAVGVEGVFGNAAEGFDVGEAGNCGGSGRVGGVKSEGGQ